jgi:hypothetical protein
MKTRAMNFFKVTTMLTLMSILMISCGKENESGKTSNSTNNGYPGISSAGNGGISLPSNWLQRVQNENPCITVNNNQNPTRQRVDVPLQGTNINAGAFYVGVTPEGDVGVVINRNGIGAVMEVYLCPRPDATGQGSLMATPVVNNSNECPVGEISRANISLSAQYGAYNLSFAPIHILGTDRTSSMCSNQQF